MTIDFFVKSITDSACNIDSAFAVMMETKNFLCAIPYIRMQLDNAMCAWAGLINDNEIKFFTSFASGEPLNQSHFSWDSLAIEGFTKERLVKEGIKYDTNHQLTNRFLYETLNSDNDGFKDLYLKGCKYVHPSSAILQASWFGSEQGTIKYKGWEDAKPFSYPEEEIVTDYINACRYLLNILLKWKKLKDINADIYRRIRNGEPLPEGVELNQSMPSQEDLMKLMKVLKHDAEESGSLPEE